MRAEEFYKEYSKITRLTDSTHKGMMDFAEAYAEQEIKELKDELIYSFRNAGLNDYEIELEFKRIKQTLK